MAQLPRQSAHGRTPPGARHRPLRRRTKLALRPAARIMSRSSGRPCRLRVLASVAAAIARELAHWHETLASRHLYPVRPSVCDAEPNAEMNFISTTAHAIETPQVARSAGRRDGWGYR